MATSGKLWAYLGVCSLSLVGCGKMVGFSSTHLIGQEGMRATFDVNKYAINKLVCDPFDGSNGNHALDGGLQASLSYLRSDQPRYESVSDMIANGVSSGQHLFFSQLNVPTRLFDLGFPIETGGVVKTDDGVDLFEYFAIRFQGVMSLAADEAEGQYQLALLSDDGAIWRNQDDNSADPILVDNDGTHPSRFGCGQTIAMARSTAIPVRIDYYQGPRYHIALIPMWRKLEPGQDPSDPSCGELGNSMYFDYENNSAPQSAYLGLLSRGWKPLRAENWRLPDSSGFNPCFDQGEVPLISEFSVQTLPDGLTIATWQTNIPATDQVLYRNLTTGQEVLTLSDNILRTRHQVNISGLLTGEAYQIQAVSISESLGKALSDTITFTAN